MSIKSLQGRRTASDIGVNRNLFGEDRWREAWKRDGVKPRNRVWGGYALSASESGDVPSEMFEMLHAHHYILVVFGFTC